MTQKQQLPENWLNFDQETAVGLEFPKMLFRKTDEEVRVIQTTKEGSLSKTDSHLVVNRYHGLLCDIITVFDADEAERMAAEGWDISPRAAHGLTEGLVTATSAKDDRIAELEARLAAMASAAEPAEPEPPRRGRPPRIVADDTAQV